MSVYFQLVVKLGSNINSSIPGLSLCPFQTRQSRKVLGVGWGVGGLVVVGLWFGSTTVSIAVFPFKLGIKIEYHSMAALPPLSLAEVVLCGLPFSLLNSPRFPSPALFPLSFLPLLPFFQLVFFLLFIFFSILPPS